METNQSETELILKEVSKIDAATETSKIAISDLFSREVEKEGQTQQYENTSDRSLLGPTVNSHIPVHNGVIVFAHSYLSNYFNRPLPFNPATDNIAIEKD